MHAVSRRTIGLWVEAELEGGRDIPEPSDPERYSGHYTLRIPPALQADAAEFAKLQGVSLNRVFSAAIAFYVGRHTGGIAVDELAPPVHRELVPFQLEALEKIVDLQGAAGG